MRVSINRHLSATAQQEHFAELVVTTDLSLTAAFREAYPPRARGRAPATEWRAASRLAKNPRVVRAMERARLLDPRQMKQEALVILSRISNGELDPRFRHGALAQLREANRALRHEAERAKTAARDLEQRQQQEGWKRLSKATALLYQTKHNGERPLTSQERTDLIFSKLAPIVPVAPVAPVAPSAPAESEEQLVEIQDLVHERQAALQAERQQARSPEPVQEECGPQPGCFPQHAQEDTPRSATPTPVGRWRTVPIPGCHPPRVRRIWEPFEEGESRDEQAA